MRRMNAELPRYFVHFFILLLILAFVIYSFFTYRNLVAAVDKKSGDKKSFVIEKDESTLTIANRLQEKGLIRSPFGFRLTVKQKGLGGKLQAGVYELSPSMTAGQIALALTVGKNDLKVTIPEGFRLEEIAAKFEDSLGIPAKEFMTAAKGKEGYLFPDTYNFASGNTPSQVIAKMKANFDKKTGSLKPTGEDIILASLIERETKGNSEKPVVAGILKKRLDAGWPLQLDATIQYIAGRSGDWWPNTTLLDRKRTSTFNTYLNPGLPPTPICNPGLASIEAAMNPTDSSYWYYLHEPSGVIHYAATSAQHEANIDKYIRE